MCSCVSWISKWTRAALSRSKINIFTAGRRSREQFALRKRSKAQRLKFKGGKRQKGNKNACRQRRRILPGRRMLFCLFYFVIIASIIGLLPQKCALLRFDRFTNELERNFNSKLLPACNERSEYKGLTRCVRCSNLRSRCTHVWIPLIRRCQYRGKNIVFEYIRQFKAFIWTPSE